MEENEGDIDIPRFEDFMKVKKFPRGDLVLLAYIMRKEVVEAAKNTHGYVYKADFDLNFSHSRNSLNYRLAKYTWHETIKDKLKNMVLRLRKYERFEDFERFANEALPFEL